MMYSIIFGFIFVFIVGLYAHIQQPTEDKTENIPTEDKTDITDINKLASEFYEIFSRDKELFAASMYELAVLMGYDPLTISSTSDRQKIILEMQTILLFLFAFPEWEGRLMLSEHIRNISVRHEYAYKFTDKMLNIAGYCTQKEHLDMIFKTHK